jgi:hypothetical protein
LFEKDREPLAQQGWRNIETKAQIKVLVLIAFTILALAFYVFVPSVNQCSKSAQSVEPGQLQELREIVGVRDAMIQKLEA